MTNYATESLSTLNTDLNAAVAGVNSLSGYATKEELTAYATVQYVQDYVDEHSGGDYLPLSGGNVTGRISLKSSQSQIVGSDAVLTASYSTSIYVGSWDESVELTANTTLSVMNGGQDFINMISNSEEYTGDQLTSYTVNVRIQFVGPNGFNKTLESSGTIGVGNCYIVDNDISFGYTFDTDLGHEDQTALVFDHIAFSMGSGGSAPSFNLNFTVDSDPIEPFSEVEFGYSDVWTVEERREETETIDPFVLSSELSGYATETYVDTKIGDINTILDSINGQII